MYFDIAKEKTQNLIKNGEAIICAIETSCDETSVAIIKNGREILSNAIYTQIPIHQKYGGVVPEIASRSHTDALIPTLKQALEDAKMTLSDIDAIAVTQGPGLIGALLTGVNFAKGLAFALEKPLIPVHHIHGHISANFIAHEDLTPPFIALAASGGHSHVLRADDYCDFTLLGSTRDDAAGEAFDKVARILSLPYPGGIHIDALAKEGNPDAFKFSSVLDKEDNYDFSFSGVKTAVINLVHNLEQKGQEIPKADIAASFQAFVVRMLVHKALLACKNANINKLVLAGGVASNSLLRASLEALCAENNVSLFVPPARLCTDNAAMIGAAAYFSLMKGKICNIDVNAFATGALDEFMNEKGE